MARLHARVLPRRRLGIAAALVAASAAVWQSPPALASTFNQLTKPGTPGVIRVRALGEQKGGFVAQSGWGNDVATNPNRTVGDVEPPAPLGAGPDCFGAPIPPDCYRQLSPNMPSVNPSATDASYHPGDTNIVVNEIKGFLAGDTILIGSPYCNTPVLSESCKRFVPGIGWRDEQPAGEVAHIAGGYLGEDYSGPGIIQLAEPLAQPHPKFEQVVKLPTLYPGLALEAAVPNAALFVGSSFLPTPPLTVTATFIPPTGARAPWDPGNRRPLYKSWNEKSVFQQYVYGSSGETKFMIPREVTYLRTTGNTFDPRTPDSWYSVEISATDATGRTVADGMTKFKLNAVVITGQHSDPPAAKQGSLVTSAGFVSDGTSPAALSRHIADIEGTMLVKPPSGSGKTYKFASCFDSDPGPKDRCGSNAYYDGHGGFAAQIGGWRCPITTDSSLNPDRVTTAYLLDPKQCQGTMSKRNETQTVGTYTVHTTLKLISPTPPPADTTFQITAFLLGTPLGI